MENLPITYLRRPLGVSCNKRSLRDQFQTKSRLYSLLGGVSFFLKLEKLSQSSQQLIAYLHISFPCLKSQTLLHKNLGRGTRWQEISILLAPNEMVGLGFEFIIVKNLGFLIKQWWRYCKKGNMLWRRVLQSIYSLPNMFLSF